MRAFFLKLIIFAVLLGLPLSFITFLVLGCIWLGKLIFAA